MAAWKKTLRASAGLVLALAPVSLPDGQLLAKSSIEAFAAALRDPMALFAARSPGARGAGATYQTKPAYTAPATGPIERVLSSARERPQAMLPADPAGVAGPVSDALPTASVAPAGTLGDILPVDPPAGGSNGFFFPVFGPGGGGGGGGGAILPTDDPSTDPAPPPPPPPPPPVGAVPEPSAWALLILGFGLVGAALRRGRSAGAQLPLA